MVGLTRTQLDEVDPSMRCVASQILPVQALWLAQYGTGVMLCNK